MLKKNRTIFLLNVSSEFPIPMTVPTNSIDHIAAMISVYNFFHRRINLS